MRLIESDFLAYKWHKKLEMYANSVAVSFEWRQRSGREVRNAEYQR